MPTTIDALPDEILSHIFYMVAAYDLKMLHSNDSRYHSTGRPRRKLELRAATTVCSRWKAILDSTGGFKRLDLQVNHNEPEFSEVLSDSEGTTVPLQDQIQENLTALSYSTTCDIHVTFHVSADSEAAAKWIEIREMTDYLHQLFNHSRQIVDLNVELSTYRLVNELSPLLYQLATLPWPRLQGLQLSYYEYGELNREPQGGGISPWRGAEPIDISQIHSLRDIDVSGIDILDSFTIPSRLEMLSIETQASTPQQWAEFSSVLRSLPKLQQLKCSSFLPSNPFEAPEFSVGSLPDPPNTPASLSKLAIYGTETSLAVVMRSLNLDALEDLYVSFMMIYDNDPKEYRDCVPVLIGLKKAHLQTRTWTPNFESILSFALPPELSSLTVYVQDGGSTINEDSFTRPRTSLHRIDEFRLILYEVEQSWRLHNFLFQLDLTGVCALSITVHHGGPHPAIEDAQDLESQQPPIMLGSLRRLNLNITGTPIALKQLLTAIVAPNIQQFSEKRAKFFHVPAFNEAPSWFNTVTRAEISIGLSRWSEISQRAEALYRFGNCETLEVLLRGGPEQGNNDEWQKVDRALATMFSKLSSLVLPSLSQLRLVGRVRVSTWNSLMGVPFEDLPMTRDTLNSAVKWRAQHGMPPLVWSFQDDIPFEKDWGSASL